MIVADISESSFSLLPSYDQRQGKVVLKDMYKIATTTVYFLCIERALRTSEMLQ